MGSTGDEFEPATAWLMNLVANDSSPHTIRAYALSLLRFLRYLWSTDREWDRATRADVRDFVLWAKQAPKFVGRKRPAQQRLAVNRVTGKRVQTSKYAPTTINHTLAAVQDFYRFHLEEGRGPVVNPVPSAGRPHGHHNPEESFGPRKRSPLRQKEPKRLPRSIPDEKFNEIFRKLRSNRDRALVAFYVSSGARASELLGLTGDMVNYGDQLIGVVRKGGDRKWIPVAADAFVWLRLYELERGVAGPGQPVWLTLREPYRPMTYDALRAVLNRVNALLGSNWTAHDLRHTFTVRALEGGMPIHTVQDILGHASLSTLTVYNTPRLEDVIEHHRRVFPAAGSRTPAGPAPGYAGSDLDTLFGRTP